MDTPDCVVSDVKIIQKLIEWLGLDLFRDNDTIQYYLTFVLTQLSMCSTFIDLNETHAYVINELVDATALRWARSCRILDESSIVVFSQILWLIYNLMRDKLVIKNDLQYFMVYFMDQIIAVENEKIFFFYLWFLSGFLCCNPSETCCLEHIMAISSFIMSCFTKYEGKLQSEVLKCCIDLMKNVMRGDIPSTIHDNLEKWSETELIPFLIDNFNSFDCEKEQLCHLFYTMIGLCTEQMWKFASALMGCNLNEESQSYFFCGIANLIRQDTAVFLLYKQLIFSYILETCAHHTSRTVSVTFSCFISAFSCVSSKDHPLFCTLVQYAISVMSVIETSLSQWNKEFDDLMEIVKNHTECSGTFLESIQFLKANSHLLRENKQIFH
ncbi:hypothetical protein PCE1_000730 [Barthelona sp. PCE]